MVTTGSTEREPDVPQEFKVLFSPLKIRNVELKNRVVFLPHATSYGDQYFAPTDRSAYYYAERAEGGAGLSSFPA